MLNNGDVRKYLGRNARTWTDPSPSTNNYEVRAKGGGQTATIACAVTSGGPIDFGNAFLPAAITSPTSTAAPLDTTVANVFHIASGAVDPDARLVWTIRNQHGSVMAPVETAVTSWLIIPAGTLTPNSTHSWSVKAIGDCWQAWCQEASSTVETFRTQPLAVAATASFNTITPVHPGGLHLGGTFTNHSGADAKILFTASSGTGLRTAELNLPPHSAGTSNTSWSHRLSALGAGNWRVCARVVTTSPPADVHIGCRGQYANSQMHVSNLLVAEAVMSGNPDHGRVGVMEALPNVGVDGPHTFVAVGATLRDDDRHAFPNRGLSLQVRVDGVVKANLQAPQIRGAIGSVHSSDVSHHLLVTGAGVHDICVTAIPTRPDGQWEPQLDLGCTSVRVPEPPPEFPVGLWCEDVDIKDGPRTSDSRVTFPVDVALAARDGHWEFCVDVTDDGATWTFQKEDATNDPDRLITSVSISATSYNGSVAQARVLCSWDIGFLPDCNGNPAPPDGYPGIPIVVMSRASAMSDSITVVICSVAAGLVDEYCFYPVDVQLIP